jgi:hypothetical protein
MGSWYTIGFVLGIGVGLGVILAGLLALNSVGMVAAAISGTVAGAAVGLLVGDIPEAVAGGVGGVLGALSAATVVHGALRRGATRVGLGVYMSLGGVLLGVLALVPVAGYVEAVVCPLLAARLRSRRAARFAGLRTLAK